MKTKETKVYQYSDEILANIEKERSEFYLRYKRNDLFKKIVLAVCFIGMVFCILVLPAFFTEENPAPIGLTFGIPMGLIGVMLVYGIVSKKIINEKLHKYFITFYNGMNKFTLSESAGITDVVLQEPGKINKEEFIESEIFKDIFEVGSRGLTEFVYKNKHFSIVDCAGQIKGQKRIVPVFVGKYLRTLCSYGDAEPIIVYRKGTGSVLPPTNIDDKKVVLENDNIVVYTNSEKWKEVFTSKILKEIENIETNKLLIDFTISAVNGKLYFALGYDDPLMIPPLLETFNPAPISQYKKELETMVKLAEEFK